MSIDCATCWILPDSTLVTCPKWAVCLRGQAFLSRLTWDIRALNVRVPHYSYRLIMGTQRVTKPDIIPHPTSHLELSAPDCDTLRSKFNGGAQPLTRKEALSFTTHCNQYGCRRFLSLGYYWPAVLLGIAGRQQWLVKTRNFWTQQLPSKSRYSTHLLYLRRASTRPSP